MTDIYDRTASKGTAVVTGASAGIGRIYASPNVVTTSSSWLVGATCSTPLQHRFRERTA